MRKKSNPPRRKSLESRHFLFRLRLFLLYYFPVVLFASYFPLIPIVSTPSTNYELSLPLIWLFLFSVLSLKDFFSYIYNIYISFRTSLSLKTSLPLLFFLFPLYLSLSALWSPNPLRALMTSGILWCLIISSVVIFTTFKKSKSFDRIRFLKIFLLSSAFFSALCWLQSLLDVLGVDRGVTLLCRGCVSAMFGFPHPSGLAIEPQFMGNLLLAPTLLSFFLLSRPSDAPSLFDRKTLLALAFFFSNTLFLTFSRGAIYSFAIAFIVLLGVNIFKLKNRTLLKTLPLLLLSFLFTLFMQGIFSAASYTDSTFLSGIEKSISQLSLGKLNLSLTPDTDLLDSQNPDESNELSPVFSGYVEESTSTRLNFNRIALELSFESPSSFLFGYGLGSAGEVMFEKEKTTSPYEIVQNEYLSLLLEVGLLGLLLTLLSFVILLMKLKNYNPAERYFLGACILSFLVSLMFFSGLPNALHAYLFPVFLAIILPSLSLPKHKFVVH